MRRKINVMLVSVAGTAILLTLLLVTVVCYDLFRKQVFEDLRVYTKFFDMLGKEGFLLIPANTPHSGRCESWPMRCQASAAAFLCACQARLEDDT